MNIEKLPKFGMGLGYRPPFLSELLINHHGIQCIEIIADHYIDVPQSKIEELELLANHFTIIPHAINLSIGSADGIDIKYLKKLAKLIRKIKPPWWSEHICFTHANSIQIGHLTPLPYTFESLEIIKNNVQLIKQEIDTPLILENITYTFEYPTNEMSEVEFVSSVIEQTDSGMLLDVTNLYINSINFNLNIADYLSKLPLNRIVQLHVAGGHWDDSFFVDSHSSTVPVEVWKLTEKIISIAPVKLIILERDEKLPPFNQIMVEIATGQQIWNSI